MIMYSIRYRHYYSGLTLIELLTAVSVLAILATIAIPSFDRMLDRRRVIGAADNLLADLRHARSESIKINQDITITFTAGSNWSYTINSNPGVNSNSGSYQGVRLSIDNSVANNAPANNTIVFQPRRGTATPNLTGITRVATFTSAKGAVIGIEMDQLSNISICTTTQTGGYPACT